MAEFSLKLEKSYYDKYGSDHIVMIKDSNKVQTDQFDPNKGYIQITYLEPYFDEYELGLQERSTKFDRSFNIRKIVFVWLPCLLLYGGKTDMEFCQFFQNLIPVNIFAFSTYKIFAHFP